MFDAGTGLFTGLGQITTVLTETPSAINQSGVDLTFNLDLVSESNNYLGGTIFAVNAIFTSAGGGGPDFLMQEGGLNILFGNFSSDLKLQKNIDVTDAQQTFATSATILIAGGDADLVAALGGAGAGVLLQTFVVFDFTPSLATTPTR